MRLITNVLAAILTISTAAWSQSVHGMDCYVGGGISFLSGPQILRDENKMGFNASGGIGFDILPSVSLIVGVDYTAFPKNESQARQEVFQQMPAHDRIGSGISIGEGGTLSVLTIAGNLKLFLGLRDGQVTPYIVAGAGFLSTSIPDVQASYLYSEQTAVVVSTYNPIVLPRTQFNATSALVASVGAGVDIPLGKTNSMFVEGRYAIGFTSFDNTTYIPIKLGMRFGI
ncbi:MAG: outer membrane beta-barrel protein [Ignavibacteriales bacterium]|nr:outer membrane beta-barrel protein [Ignavibacteriales bacterium]